MTRVLNSIDAATAQRIRDAIAGKPQLRAAKPKRARSRDAWRRDPVIAARTELFPDGRLGLWVPVRLRTPNEPEFNHWKWGRAAWGKWIKYVEGIADVYFQKYAHGLRPDAIEEVWIVQAAPKNFFDGGDNLGYATKKIRDCFCRYIGRDDASWKKGAIRWRYMWTKTEREYGCLMLVHGKSENGRYDRVKDGHVDIPRADGSVLVINARDELRDTP